MTNLNGLNRVDVIEVEENVVKILIILIEHDNDSILDIVVVYLYFRVVVNYIIVGNILVGIELFISNYGNAVLVDENRNVDDFRVDDHIEEQVVEGA